MINRYYKTNIECNGSDANKVNLLIERKETELTEIKGGCLFSGEEEDCFSHDSRDLIFFITHGTGTIKLSEKIYSVKKGNLVYIPACTAYQISASTDSCIDYIQFHIFDQVSAESDSVFSKGIGKKEQTAKTAENDKVKIIKNHLAEPICLSNPDQGKVYEFGSNTTTLLLERNNTNNVEFALIRWPEGSRGAMAAHKDKEQSFYILSGNGQVTIDGKTEEVNPGHVVFVPRATPHTSEALEGDLVYLCLNSLVNPNDESFDTMYKRIIPGRMKRWKDGKDEIGE
jgi:mannose-6-phosphate isomerase-like protein (cupin superfamily)